MDTQDWYTVNEFAPGTFQVTEGGRFNMFFIVGNERALALDGGIGIGGLCRLYESITDLPIDFVLTHTHWDHVGAASQWDKIGVHPNGKGQLANDLSNFCQGFLKGWDKPLPQGFDPASYNIKPPVFGWEVKEGDVIDLGGRRLRVYGHPGALAVQHLAPRRQRGGPHLGRPRPVQGSPVHAGAHGGAFGLRPLPAQTRETGGGGEVDLLRPHAPLPGRIHSRRDGRLRRRD